MGNISMTSRKYPRKLKIRIQDEVLEFELSDPQQKAVVLRQPYNSWIDGFTDTRTAARITLEVSKMRRGLLGDWKETDGVFEKRLDYGPGYRIYYQWFGDVVILLLGGGDKGSQKKDMNRAKDLWQELQNEITEV